MNRYRLLLVTILIVFTLFVIVKQVYELSLSEYKGVDQYKENTDNYIIPTDNRSREYSSVQCIGNDGNLPKPEQTICRFDNICYSINHSNKISYDTNIHPKGKFFYFANKLNPPDYITNDYGKILFDFQKIPIGFKSKWKLKIHMKYDSIPSLIVNSSSEIVWFDENIIFHEPFFPANFGHTLGDDFLATYRILDKFGLYSSYNCRIIFFHYFNLIYWGGKESDRKRIVRSNRFYKEINEYIYDRPYIHLTQFEDELIQNNRNINYLCFKTAVVSSTTFARQTHDAFEWSSFLDIFLNKYDVHKQKIKALYNSQKQKVLFLSKSEGWHGRSWANNDTKSEIVDYLADLFKIEIDMVYDHQLSNISLREQINFALKYTILIAPAGAVSYLGAFMAPNTCVIIKDIFDWRNKRSSHLDWWLWNYDHRKMVYYISTKQSDAKFKLSWDRMLAKGDTQLSFAFRDAADFYLEPKKVAYLVYNALQWVEKRLNWKDTYYLPPNWQDYMTSND